MTTNLPARIEEINQRWIIGVVNGKVQVIKRIGPCALVVTPEALPRLILLKNGWGMSWRIRLGPRLMGGKLELSNITFLFSSG